MSIPAMYEGTMSQVHDVNGARASRMRSPRIATGVRGCVTVAATVVRIHPAARESPDLDFSIDSRPGHPGDRGPPGQARRTRLTISGLLLCGRLPRGWQGNHALDGPTVPPGLSGGKGLPFRRPGCEEPTPSVDMEGANAHRRHGRILSSLPRERPP